MRKTVLMLAVILGFAGLQVEAEARGGNSGGGRGGRTMGAEPQGGAWGMQGAGTMSHRQERNQLRNRNQTRDGTGQAYGAGDKTQQRLQLRDPSLHSSPPDATPAR